MQINMSIDQRVKCLQTSRYSDLILDYKPAPLPSTFLHVGMGNNTCMSQLYLSNQKSKIIIKIFNQLHFEC